ncbi:hypothetical protein [Limnofasciculus baicalensis]|uniref:Uncharacterized protein n=1 Tax=Limnofasciculus baicalensis BBK-W-15 TaxID=2699891 RepID=A0AAE3GN64_9CYAN|nr:hypothetical protein [Limnofasciculus baicalensis]MCP2727675.1 hypothetical protein [Limnofasciculus baicalensis BBK-W-15]
MVSDRISQLQHNLEILYERRNALEQGRLLTPDDDKAIQNQQTIQIKIRPQIREYEEELFLRLQQESASVTFVEADAQVIVDALSQEIVRVQLQPDKYTEEMVELLKSIEAKLNQPGATADAKLKGTLSIFPPFIGLSYEASLDTENFCRQHFPTFTRLIKGAKK